MTVGQPLLAPRCGTEPRVPPSVVITLTALSRHVRLNSDIQQPHGAQTPRMRRTVPSSSLFAACHASVASYARAQREHARVQRARRYARRPAAVFCRDKGSLWCWHGPRGGECRRHALHAGSTARQQVAAARALRAARAQTRHAHIACTLLLLFIDERRKAERASAMVPALLVMASRLLLLLPEDRLPPCYRGCREREGAGVARRARLQCAARETGRQPRVARICVLRCVLILRIQA